jgi:hexokinase
VSNRLVLASSLLPLTTCRGGTNLRVAFIELLGSTPQTIDETSARLNGDQAVNKERSRVVRHLEKSWPIGDQLKHDKPADLFAWIGECIAGVVRDGLKKWPGELGEEVALGVTFSFAMKFVLSPLYMYLTNFLGKRHYRQQQ